MARDERVAHPSDALGFVPGEWRSGKDNAGKTHTRGGTTGEEAHKRLEEEIAKANEEADDDE